MEILHNRIVSIMKAIDSLTDNTDWLSEFSIDAGIKACENSMSEIQRDIELIFNKESVECNFVNEKINERLKLDHKPNPELSYRSRKGTGIKKINQIKQIK